MDSILAPLLCVGAGLGGFYLGLRKADREWDDAIRSGQHIVFAPRRGFKRRLPPMAAAAERQAEVMQHAG